MTTLEFKKNGYRRLTSPNTLQSVIDYINTIDMELNVTLDLRGCVFSYLFARIFEAVVVKLNMNHGEKTLTLIHGYATATENHLIPYLTKNNDTCGTGVTTMDGLIKSLKDLNIAFELVGPDHD